LGPQPAVRLAGIETPAIEQFLHSRRSAREHQLWCAASLHERLAAARRSAGPEACIGLAGLYFMMTRKLCSIRQRALISGWHQLATPSRRSGTAVAARLMPWPATGERELLAAIGQ
jgi:hypothetical protein